MSHPKNYNPDHLRQPMPLWQKITGVVIGLIFLSLSMSSLILLIVK